MAVTITGTGLRLLGMEVKVPLANCRKPASLVTANGICFHYPVTMKLFNWALTGLLTLLIIQLVRWLVRRR